MTQQNGSAILWILIAIGLFAALSYAFNSSTRTSSTFLTDTEADTYAMQIVSLGNDVASAVKRMELRGCDAGEISFENGSVGGYTNPNAPSDNSCHAFNSKGGSLNWPTINKKSILDSNYNAQESFGNFVFTGKVYVVDNGTDCGDESCNEIIMIMSFLTSDICNAINNKILNYNHALAATENITGVLPDDNDKFDGTYSYLSTASIGNNDSFFAGKSQGCIFRGASGYSYYKVLLSQ